MMNRIEAMMSKEIYDKVVAAMGSACDDMRRFSGNPLPLDAEYLFTVAVAKKIDELNNYYGEPYKIYLERSVPTFAKDCLLPLTFNRNKRGASIVRANSPTIDKGRIDVTVYRDYLNTNYSGYQPVCAIELKGFNPAGSLVMKDLRRNVRYFNVTGSTGKSVLKYAIFSAFHSFKKTGSEADERKKKERLKGRYQSWLMQLGNTPNLHMQIKVHSVSKDLVGTVTDEAEYQWLDTDTVHHFFGVTVEFRTNYLCEANAI